MTALVLYKYIHERCVWLEDVNCNCLVLTLTDFIYIHIYEGGPFQRSVNLLVGGVEDRVAVLRDHCR